MKIATEVDYPAFAPVTEERIEAVFVPTIGSEEELARAAYLASLADPSRIGKMLAQASATRRGLIPLPKKFDLVSASPVNDLSGINMHNGKLREGTLESVERWVRKLGGHVHSQVRTIVKQTINRGDSAVVIASEKIVLGVVLLKIVKPL